MKVFVLLVTLFQSLLAFSADRQSLAGLDQAIMRPPPFPRKWETNLTQLTATAQKGDPDAQFDLAMHCVYGRGTPQNLPAAFELVRRAANQNYAPAQYVFGVFHKYGIAVATNLTTADEWFQKAANQGYVPAKHETAIAADSHGKRDEALKLLREAADNGFPSSQYLLGCLATNVIESYVWHSLAAPSVELSATRQLELRQQLTKEELAEAEDRIGKFKKKFGAQPATNQAGTSNASRSATQ